MKLKIQRPELEINKIISFLRKTYKVQGNKSAVIAVSGGIDSALSLTLLSKALGKDKITPVLLPYDNQDVSDSKLITNFNGFKNQNIVNLNIKPVVDFSAKITGSQLGGWDDNKEKQLRLGNIMARSRMILLYDIAKQKNALVCGTENKSEKYLGYFTRFGDEASDIEPLVHLYKTQIRQLSKYLNLPKEILEKAPSAGLWQGQADEKELGFSYRQADLVLHHIFDQKKPIEQLDSVPKEEINKVISRVKKMDFKQQVPYHL